MFLTDFSLFSIFTACNLSEPTLLKDMLPSLFAGKDQSSKYKPPRPIKIGVEHTALIKYRNLIRHIAWITRYFFSFFFNVIFCLFFNMVQKLGGKVQMD